ncbi:MAG: site-specific integrase [Deltaproteobacteria bacterium]|nr:site-specific integrase [Deltaproteobacteria bacterium]
MNLYKRGNIWWCKFRVDNILHQYSCKTKDKNVAAEVAAALNADVVRKKFDIPQKYKKEYIFNEVWGEYIKSQTTLKKTIESKINASKHFSPFFAKPIQSISTDMLENYKFKRKLEMISMPKNIGKREQEISFRTVNIELNTLNHFFNYCIEKAYLDKNPASGIKKLNELSRLKTLSDEDINKLIAGAGNKLTRDLITFLIYTGCRKGEALNLKWDDVDLKNDVIAVKATKTKYDRYIPISKPLKELLRGIEKKDDVLYVFNRNGAKIGNFRKSFMTACRNAGLKDLRIHDLRHVFASKMVMNGTSLYITGELLGHRTTQMTKRYSHLVPDTLKKAVDDVWGKKENFKRGTAYDCKVQK